MADLPDLGVTTEPSDDGLRVDLSELADAALRLSWAARELQAAWRGMPPGARQRIGAITVTLDPNEDVGPRPDPTPPDGARVRRQG